MVASLHSALKMLGLLEKFQIMQYIDQCTRALAGVSLISSDRQKQLWIHDLALRSYIITQGHPNSYDYDYQYHE